MTGRAGKNTTFLRKERQEYDNRGVPLLAQDEGLWITLPLPPAKLHPNSRGHFMAKARHTKAYRLKAMLTADRAMAGIMPPPLWSRALVQAHFYYRGASRRRDRDNGNAWLKAAFDGIADAGVVPNDDAFIHMPPLLYARAAEPRVELHVVPMGGEQ